MLRARDTWVSASRAARATNAAADDEERSIAALYSEAVQKFHDPLRTGSGIFPEPGTARDVLAMDRDSEPRGPARRGVFAPGVGRVCGASPFIRVLGMNARSRTKDLVGSPEISWIAENGPLAAF